MGVGGIRILTAVELVFPGKRINLMSFQCSGEFLAGHHAISWELFRYEDNVCRKFGMLKEAP